MEQVSSLKTGVKYKDTPIGKIPVDWEVVRLGDVCDVIGGSTPSTKNNEYWGGEIPFATPTDITSLQGREISDTKQSITQEGLSSCGARLLPVGSVLLTSRATLGACAINTKPMATNQGFASLVCNEMAYNWFIFYKMIALQQELDRLGSGSTFKEVSKSSIRSLNFSLPPLPEQKRITDILTTVDGAIEKTTQIIDKTKELKKGLMQRLLTRGIGHKKFKKTEIGEIPVEWEFVNLGKMIYLQGGFAFKSNNYEGKGLPLVRISNVTPNGVMLNECVCLPDSFAEQFSSFLLEPGDVLVAMSGATTGKIGVVPNKDLPALFNQRVGRFVIKGSNLIAKSYLAQVALTKRFKQDLLIDAAGGAQPNVSGKNIEKITILLPPLQEQKKIADILTSIDNEIEKESNHKEQLELLKKGLMQVLLTGKLRVAV